VSQSGQSIYRVLVLYPAVQTAAMYFIYSWFIGFEVLTVVNMMNTIFRDVVACRPVVHRRFGETYRFRLQDRKVSQASNQQASNNVCLLLACLLVDPENGNM
jgi:hypothetical protein